MLLRAIIYAPSVLANHSRDTHNYFSISEVNYVCNKFYRDVIKLKLWRLKFHCCLLCTTTPNIRCQRQYSDAM